MSKTNYSEECNKLINQIRANAPLKEIRKKHLVLGFKFDYDWALKKYIPLYGEVDEIDLFDPAYGRNIILYRAHCMRESGINAGYLSVRVTDVIGPDGVKEYRDVIGISENRRVRRKLPPLSGIRNLMKILETDEAPKWY